MSDMENRICDAKILVVAVFEKEQEVVPTVEALLAGGITGMELALRSPYALDAVKLIRQKYPEMLLGVGTVLSPQQVEQVADFTDFAVAPGLNRRVIEAARKRGLPFYPGITTASEIETALEYDIRLLKYFPAESVGGLEYLRNMNAPYAHLGLKYIPLGGLGLGNLADYLQSPIVGAVGGSWIASRKWIASEDWPSIRQEAARAVAMSQCS
ncbi:bifunctional 4-hydroxy-2-oxoglutarate aldolase/2-dehydro-3-deoxy-phosphogluconate aldolase [Candidatus Haliotispira prima]|uniref:Bifunctional 4-hydroxy-2-oxoglutarate aldolase/2-dehydro-3-deoxy-phosphogluconate aldolase n=1 Tax=Candidatus Haliotispira prima TaxID=3034016 RepID=A0ABY8MIW1_9SPIO|nr:bifunctional 4-hydroxy-2-oxoglutarate aldolase/2-dehydro-3-deoxy-phosphogluconate aldolase [Candidatus Haliotispira prima]